MRIFAVLMAIGLSGCASVEPIAMKDGKQLYQSKCSRSSKNCYALASKTCNGKFDITDSTSTWLDEFTLTFTCK